MLCIRHLLERDGNRVRVNASSLEVLQYYANSIAFWRNDEVETNRNMIEPNQANMD